MSFWVQRERENESRVAPPRLSSGRRTGFVENYIAQRDSMEKSFLTSSRANVFSDAYRPVVEALNADLAPGQRRFLDPVAPTPDIRPSEETRWLRMSEDQRANEIWQEIKRRRSVDAGALPQIPESREIFERQILDNVREVVEEAADVSGRSTTGGAVGGFVGGVVGTFKDPVNLATLPIGAPRAWGILRTALTEGAINAGVEVATFPGVKKWRDELGLGYTIDDLGQNMMFAAGGGAVIGGGIKTLARVFGPARETLEADPATLMDMIRRQLDRENQSPTVRGARDAAERERELTDAQPADDADPRQAGEHRNRVNQSLSAADDGELPNIPARPVDEPAPSPDMELHGNLDGVHFRFHPDELNIDAPRFQFKSGGDDAGVTDRLAGLGRWDPVKAGLIVVWEDASGARFIADGHQRLGLAKRLSAEDPNIRLYGFLLREGDGITAANAREIAAIKNIAEGSGSAVDAAKILRVNPDRLGELPLTSGLVRVARDLVNLEDDAFMMVVNELVPVNYAALVGRLAGDRPEIQGQILGVLARLGPDNATQAESIVRQAIEAGTTRETQIGLFGEEDLAISLFAERALVLDRALKKLRRDRTVFNTLVGDKAKIEEAGNRLAGDINAQRAKTDAEAIQTLQKLAHRKGPLSDALNDAAERARSGDVAGAVDEFVQRTRTLAADGTLARLNDGAGPRGGDADAQGGGRPPPDANLRPDEDFSEPAGSGQAAQADRLESEIRGEIDRAGGQAEGAPAARQDLETEFIGRDDEFWGVAVVGDRTVFKDTGFSAVECTGYACAIRGKLGRDRVEVFGYEAENNPTSAISDIAGGHDFAVVDGRYIVDPWIVDVEAVSNRGVHDLADPADAAEIARIYGDHTTWRRAAFEGDKIARFEDVPADEAGQFVIPGAERISDKELAERGMEGKAKPKAPQQEDIGGIFDVNARGQVDLEDLDVPVSARLDDQGDLVMESRKASDLLDEIEADNDFVDALDLVCGPKGGKA